MLDLPGSTSTWSALWHERLSLHGQGGIIAKGRSQHLAAGLTAS